MNDDKPVVVKEPKTYTCDCGKTVRIASKAVHNKTKFHRDYFNPILNPMRVVVTQGDYFVNFT